MRADRHDLLLVERGGRHQHLRRADRHARADRLGAEGREQGAEHRARLPGAERGEVELGDAPGQRVHAVACPHAEGLQHVREPVGGGRELGEREVAPRAGLAEPADGDALAQCTRAVPVDRLVRDIEAPAARQPVEQPPRRVPGERGARGVVVPEVRGDG
jgi:hypothetical protein